MFENNQQGKERATIGSSLTIKGEITGAEDLLILGTVEGKIELEENTLTIGKSAVVRANTAAKVVRVQGQVQGDLTGFEQVIIERTAQVEGNVTTPRLTFEDGARLKGAISVEPNATKAMTAQPTGTSAPLSRIERSVSQSTSPTKRAPAASAESRRSEQYRPSDAAVK